ncbi:MAG: tryptophan--tRNA ligase [Verrucomicrobia bacterium]|nr:tryptophan--tRNA ligase [Verrucomicrobiota bacterium]MBV9657559.1 tryptophan--tRNA ligase [Verrucomicrobiota bacterium]
MSRILSGIQPSGALHLGNYFGMMQPAIALQERGEAFYFIADYHALTSVQNAARLREFTHGVALDFLACGLNPARACFFRQSDVPQVTELAWILSNVTPVPMLQNAHSYKDKTARGLPASAGLFTYPVLMAADILLYDSDLVPVGRDQKQHLEMTRDIAGKINELYGADLLKLPAPVIQETTAVVPGLDGQKMSKSYGNTIEIFLEEKALRKKVLGLKTDSTPLEAPKLTEDSTILALYRLVASPAEVEKMENEFRTGGVGYGEFKHRLFAAIWEYFAPMRARRAELLADAGAVERVLRAGAERARTVADSTLARVRKAVGLR